MLRITVMSQGAIYKVLQHFCESSKLTFWLRVHRLETTTSREDRVVRIIRRKRFLSVFRIKVGLIRRTGHSVVVCTAQRGLVAAGYRSKHPGCWPRLTTDHRLSCHMLAHRHQNWNHQHWSHVLFAYESKVNLSNCNGRVRIILSCCWKASGLLHPKQR